MSKFVEKGGNSLIKKIKAAIKQRQEKRASSRLERMAAFVPIKLDYTQSDSEKKFETIYNERKDVLWEAC